MRRWIAIVAGLVLASPSWAAETTVNWGLTTGAEPRTLCVYDTSTSHTCVAAGSLNSTTHALGISPPNVINVLTLGADPTGVSDSAPAFRAAMGSNRRIIVPPGTYRFASTQTAICCAFNPAAVLVQGYSNFEISGYGATITIADAIALSSAFQFDQDSHFVVQGLTIQGNRTGVAAGAESVGITLSSDVDFLVRDMHFSGNFGGGGTMFAGDWLVDGTIENIKGDALGKCDDFAFLKNVTLRNIHGYGADTNGASGAGQIGQNCIGIANDVPNAGTNNTGVSFTETNGVTVTGVSATNFAVGANVLSGKNILFTGNHWYLNPGCCTNSHGIGIYIHYNASGNFTSVGVPPGNIIINGDNFDNNGASIFGWGIYIVSSTIVNSDRISNILVNNSIFNNNNNIGIETDSATLTTNVVLGEGNAFFGASQTKAIGDNLATITTHRGALPAGVSAVADYTDGYVHTTVLTLNAVFPAIAGGASLGVAKLIYVLPAGAELFESSYMSVSITQTQGNINANTPKVGLGTSAAGGAISVLNGTPAFMNLITEQTAANCTGTATVKTAIPTAGVPLVTEAGGAKNVYVNAAAAWSAGGDAAALLTGTVVLHWQFMQ